MKKNFLQVKDQDIIDGNGNKVILRGVGIGGWLLPEGYMWGSYKKIDRPRRFQTFIEKCLGTQEAKHFWETYYDRFFNEDDLKSIKTLGFNSIRIAIDYEVLFEPSIHSDTLDVKAEGFKRLDEIIDLCEVYELYVILDLHAAPGGQTGANIDNSEHDQPELFIHKPYLNQTIFIWAYLSNRYKERSIIAAYDLLNEPLPEWFNRYDDMVIPLYKDIIKAIRKHDPYHIISLEGTHWSTKFDIFEERLDDQVLLHFHKYWSAPDVESIRPFLDTRKKLNYPLFMGEGGENSLSWYYGAFKLYEQQNISWNFWAYKKIDNKNSIVSFNKPVGWHELFNEDIVMDHNQVKSLLNEFLDNIQTKDAIINQSVVDHLFFKNNITFDAIYFDYLPKSHGVSKAVSNDNITRPFRLSDGIEVVNLEGHIIEPNTKHFVKNKPNDDEMLYLKIHQNDWYQYTFYIDTVTPYQMVNVTLTHHKSCDVIIYINHIEVTEIINQNDNHTTYQTPYFKHKNILRITGKKDTLLQKIQIQAIL